jgi:4'-phosphopantetheinyl transferase EntD
MDEERLRTLFAVPVAACIADPAMYEAPLAPGEGASVARARPRRVREFAAGRAAARAALARIGITAQAIPRAGDGTPLWPPGAVGSISHCDGFCAAVVARARDGESLGFDAEPAAPLPRELIAMVCTPAEIAWSRSLEPPPDTTWPMVLFSAKEAFYKAWYPRTRQFLDFQDVALELAPEKGGQEGAFRLSALRLGSSTAGMPVERFVGRWGIADRRIHCGVTLPHP